MLDTVVMSGDDVCCSVVFGTLVGVFVFSAIWSELLMTSAISCPLWSSVYECQRVECAFTSPMQDYKHRVFGEPSDICTDCGASPQDVRHLFACTTHPTDLSPEDLWRNPVRSIRAFSYLDNGNLD